MQLSANTARDGELRALATLSEATAVAKAQTSILELELTGLRAQLASTRASPGDGEELFRCKQELRAARKAADAFREEARIATHHHGNALRSVQERIDLADNTLYAVRSQLTETERLFMLATTGHETRVSELSWFPFSPPNTHYMKIK